MPTIFENLRAPIAGSGDGWALFAGLPRTMGQSLFDRLLLWQERAAQRHALAQLDEPGLKDIGLSRAEAQREAGKPFWRA